MGPDLGSEHPKDLTIHCIPGMHAHDWVRTWRKSKCPSTRRKAQADPERDAVFLILLDALIFRTEAEVRWLDASEARSRRVRAAAPGRGCGRGT